MFLNKLSSDDKQTIIQHLEDLRKSVLISVIAVLITTVASFYYSDKLMAIAMYPLSGYDQKLIVTGVTEAFFVKLQLSFLAGFILAFPVVLWALWRFIKPALYPGERKYVYVILPCCLLLFAVGVSFAYFVVMKVILSFFITMAGNSLDTMFKVDQYVSFVVGFIIPFGLIFQMPVISFFLTRLGILKYELLAKNRKYAILIFAIVGALLTPPDPISQLMMAIPMYLLYEISVLIAKYARRKAPRQELA